MAFSIRRMVPEDHELVRTVRLRALTLAPTAFGSTFDREVLFSADDWSQRLRPDRYPHCLCLDEAGQPLGLVVGGPEDLDRGIAHLFAMWVEPHAHGTGVADGLVEEVVRWAGTQGCSLVHLLVTDGNERAERMYHRNGFERTGQSAPRERDGVAEIEMARRLA